MNNSIKNYLDNVEKIKNHKLLLSSERFELIQDDICTGEIWRDFETITGTSKFIHAKSQKETYLLPKASFNENEFEKTKEYIKNIVKDKYIEK